LGEINHTERSWLGSILYIFNFLYVSFVCSSETHMSNLSDLQALTDEQLIEKVAVEVMGFERRHGGWNRKGEWVNDAGFSPLTDWNHTMEVVEKVRKQGSRFDLFINQDAFIIELRKVPQRGSRLPVIRTNCFEYPGDRDKGESSPQRPICLAALLALHPKTI
jgi:hypothetical protein